MWGAIGSIRCLYNTCLNARMSPWLLALVYDWFRFFSLFQYFWVFSGAIFYGIESSFVVVTLLPRLFFPSYLHITIIIIVTITCIEKYLFPWSSGIYPPRHQVVLNVCLSTYLPICGYIIIVYLTYLIVIQNLFLNAPIMYIPGLDLRGAFQSLPQPPPRGPVVHGDGEAISASART